MKLHCTLLRLTSLTFVGILQIATVHSQVIINARDLVLSFRQTGGGATPTDVGIDIGQASLYYNAVSSFSIAQYTPAQLSGVYSSLNNLSWSIAGATKSGDGGDAAVPNSTLWVTRPRSDVNVQTSPWVAKSAFSQGGTAQRIFGINNGLGSTFASQVSVSMATIPDGDTQSAHNYLTDLGNYQGTFQGDVANSTGTFTQPVRSDLYELRPASGNPDGRYLGYFELSPNGGMSFNSAFAAVPEPSSYAIAVGAALVVFGAFRRRARQSSE